MLQRQMSRKIQDHLRDGSVEDKTPDFLFISEFVTTPSHPLPLKLSHICSGKLQHLNLKHISRLESNLHSLFERIIALLSHY